MLEGRRLTQFSLTLMVKLGDCQVLFLVDVGDWKLPNEREL